MVAANLGDTSLERQLLMVDSRLDRWNVSCREDSADETMKRLTVGVATKCKFERVFSKSMGQEQWGLCF